MSAFLSAALRGELPEAGFLPGLIILVVFGILALGSRMISRPERVEGASAPDRSGARVQSLN